MTRYYYQWQTDSFLSGTTEELRQYHMDYAPGDTKPEALARAAEYFMEKRDYYGNIATEMNNRIVQAEARMNKLNFQ